MASRSPAFVEENTRKQVRSIGNKRNITGKHLILIMAGKQLRSRSIPLPVPESGNDATKFCLKSKAGRARLRLQLLRGLDSKTRQEAEGSPVQDFQEVREWELQKCVLSASEFSRILFVFFHSIPFPSVPFHDK